jgi:hypothetical protein
MNRFNLQKKKSYNMYKTKFHFNEIYTLDSNPKMV